MKHRNHLMLFLLALLMVALTACQASAASPGGKLLVLYKERDKFGRPNADYVATFLKKAGYITEFRDIEALIAEKESDLTGFQGLVTCYQGTDMKGADRYPAFLLKQMAQGRKVVIIGSYGAFQGLDMAPEGHLVPWNVSTKTINTFFYPFGLKFLFGWTGDSSKLEATFRDPSMVEYEAPLLKEHLTYYQYFKSVNKDNKVFLELQRTDFRDSKSAAVVITPYGGLLMEGYGFFWDAKTGKVIQRVNMEKFLARALEGPCPPVVPQFTVTSHEELLKANPLPPFKEASLGTPKGSEKRKVLVLYKKSENRKLDENPLRRRGEIVLNYLGMVPVYKPVEEGLPGADEMTSYRAVITWFSGPYMKQAEEYGKWLIRQVESGIRVVILQNYGAFIDGDNFVESPNYRKVFKALGMDCRKLKDTAAGNLPGITLCDQAMIGFEHRPAVQDLDYYYVYTSKDEANRVYLSLLDNVNGTVDLAVITPHGGMALDTAPYYEPLMNKGKRLKQIKEAQAGYIEEPEPLGAWIINPFLFFEKALALEAVPVPDCTTINGNRIFMSHVDGDAFTSISLIDRMRLAGDYVIEEIFKVYPGLPFSVSLITNDIEHDGNEYYNQALELGRAMYRLPNVEPATHSADHPFDWQSGELYVANPEHYPWKIGYRDLDLTLEIWASKLFMEKNILPAGKPCPSIFWSGACNPDAAAVKIAGQSGLLNLNYGNPMLDGTHPSIAYLVPLALSHGGLLQVCNMGANDYIYTGYLLGDWGGMKNVVETFKNTGSPRRLTAIDLYYHFYGGIKQVSLDALKYALDYCLACEIAPVYASHYCRIVNDFYATSLVRERDGWSVINGGNLRTVRFNGTVYPDIERSKGVIGYCHSQGQTYVHLDGSAERRIVLASGAIPFPHLRQATFSVDRASLATGSIEMEAWGFGKARFLIAGLAPSTSYRVRLSLEGGEMLWEKDLPAAENGTLLVEEMLKAPVKHYRLKITKEARI
ncbi:MAG: DUF2194 domain-containing protein [Candidatus Eremiobacteraeota bacterium]|nr:DUF2194 domain-containing protein [Candidatus Eremiobacteraeota bacterium]